MQKALWEAARPQGPAEDSEMEEAEAEELTGRILVVDDDPHFVRVLNRILSREKFRVTGTTGACEAIELFGQSPFDLIICDLRMPDCDGLNFLQTIRRGGHEVPVIILTAYGEVDTYLEAMNAGASEYLNKPVNTVDLLRVVRSCLREKNHK